MKKNPWKYLLILGMTIPMAVLSLSCSDDDTGKDPDPDPTPVVPDDNGNIFITTDNVTPLRYTDLKYIGGDEGVSIEVTDNGTDNIRFTCVPGADIRSYRVNVYPVSSLYNTLLNQLNTETEVTEYTTDQVNDLIYMMISNVESETSGGKLMNVTALGDDYASYEFDWMDSGYAAFSIKPDADYLIVVQGYFDEAGTASPGDLCLCHVLTPEKALVGNPVVELNVETGYYSYQVTHIPNDDCAGYYYLSTTTAEIQEYIDAYGEKTYMDLLRHFGGLVSVSSGNLAYRSNDEQQGVEYCATALAVDVNGTPSKTLARQDFFLKETPENVEEATGTVSLPHKIASSVCHFNVHLDANCLRLSYYAYPAAQADEIMAWDESQRKALAQRMVEGTATAANPGWVVVNQNYALDRDNDKLTGSDYTNTEWQHELTGNTEYKIIYACMNGYGQATDLKATESFKTKVLVKDNPTACTADVTLQITQATRTAFYVEHTYDRTNVARIYWQYYSPISEGAQVSFPNIEDSSDEARYDSEKGWLYWFLDWRDPIYDFPWPNENLMLIGDGIGKDVDYFAGFESGTTYYFAYMAEDWNGVLSPVRFFNGTTQATGGGDNPTVQISYERQDNGSYRITYTCNEDMRQLKYLIADSSSAEDTRNLGLSDLLKTDFGGVTYEEYMESWSDHCMQNGLTTTSLTTTQTMSSTSDIAVALALPIGGATEGEPVYGDLQTLVYRKSTGELKTLAEYMGVETSQTSGAGKVAARMNTQRPVRVNGTAAGVSYNH